MVLMITKPMFTAYPICLISTGQRALLLSFKSCRVVAVEPNTDCVRHTNLAMNNHNSVPTLQAAVGADGSANVWKTALGILFPSQKGGAMTRMQFLRLFRKYALAVGVSPDLAHPHILRHSLCSTMAADHADVYAIQQRAGHKNISNTMIYTHVSDDQASEWCRGLGSISATQQVAGSRRCERR
jgi:integrase